MFIILNVNINFILIYINAPLKFTASVTAIKRWRFIQQIRIIIIISYDIIFIRSNSLALQLP
ncbi:MAG: hypothetical protein M3P47_04070 [Pseudomonadota bacterium]|nr:hypothetical protein [Pseudomonadota bacterium]